MFRSRTEHFGNHGENQFAYRESPAFKEGVRLLEEDKILSPQDRVLILAVALGLKPASSVFTDKDAANVDLLETMFSKLGLFFCEEPRPDRLPMHKDLVFYAIGNTPENLHEALSAVESRDSDQFGKAMGYPETAVEAFSDQRGSSAALEPIHNPRLTDEERAFSFFRFSRENFEKEVEFLEQIIAATKTYAPKLYKEVLSKDAL